MQVCLPNRSYATVCILSATERFAYYHNSHTAQPAANGSHSVFMPLCASFIVTTACL